MINTKLRKKVGAMLCLIKYKTMCKNLLVFVLLLASAKNILAIEIHEVSIEIETPNPCYMMLISDIYTNDKKSVVVAQVIPPPEGTGCIAMIGQAKAKLNLATKLPDDILFVVLGRNWCWETTSGEPGDYISPRSAEELSKLVGELSKVFSQEIPQSLLPPEARQWNSCEIKK